MLNHKEIKRDSQITTKIKLFYQKEVIGRELLEKDYLKKNQKNNPAIALNACMLKIKKYISSLCFKTSLKFYKSSYSFNNLK